MATNPNVKIDLSQTVKEVSELNQALQSLGAISSELFNNLGRLSQTFGSQISGLQQNAEGLSQTGGAQSPQSSGSAPANYITPTGRQAAEQADSDQARRMQRFERTRQSLEQGTYIEKQGMYFHRQHSAQGTSFYPLMGVQEFEEQRKSVAEEAKSRIQGFGQEKQQTPSESQQATPEQAPEQKLTPEPQDVLDKVTGANQRQQRLDAAGVTTADVARTLRESTAGDTSDQQQLESVSDAITQLNATSREASEEQSRLLKDTASVLEGLRDDFKQSSEDFTQAVKNFSEVSQLDKADPRRQEAEQELMAATGRRNRLADEIQQTQQQAQQTLETAGGGPGGPVGPTIGERISGGAKFAGAALGVGAGAAAQYREFLGLQQTLDQTTFGARLAGEQFQAETSTSQYQIGLGAADPTTAENLLKYRGDLLFDQTSRRFTGTGGLERAMEESMSMEQQRRGMEQRQRTIDLMGTLGQGMMTGAALVGGVGMMAGGIGAIPGAVLGGVTGLSFAGLGAAKSFFGNERTALTGELEESRIARMAAGTENFEDMARDARFKQEQLLTRNVMQNARALQDAEVQQEPGKIRAIQEILDLEDAEKAAVSLVGGDALNRDNILGIYNRAAQTGGIKDIVQQRKKGQLAANQYRSVADAFRTVRDTQNRETEEFQRAQQVLENNPALERRFKRAEQLRQAGGGLMSEMTIEEVDASKGVTRQRIEDFEMQIPMEQLDPSGDMYKARVQQILASTQSPVGGIDQTRLTTEQSMTLMQRVSTDLGRRTQQTPMYQQVAEQNEIPVDDAFELQAGVGAELAQQIRGTTSIPTEFQRMGMSPEGFTRLREMTDMEISTGVTAFGRGRFLEMASRGASEDAGRAFRRSLQEAGVNPSRGVRTMTRKVRTPDTIFSRLEMTPAEIIQRNAQLGAALDVEGAPTMQQTEDLVNLSRAGLGDFGTLTGNLSQLSGVAGGEERNLERLEEVMSDAVSAGFDKSRMAQNFVQTTTSLASAMQTRDVEAVSRRLSTGAMVTGVEPGEADALSLQEAAQSMQSYSQLTQQTTGAMGAFKMLGAIEGGAGIGRGLFTTMSMSDMQLANAEEQLEQGEILDPALAQQVSAEANRLRSTGVPSGQARKQAKQNVTGRISSSRDKIRTHNQAVLEVTTGIDVEKQISQISGLPEEERLQAFQGLLGQAREAGTAQGVGTAYLTPVLEMGVESGILDEDRSDRMRRVQERISEGREAYRDVGRQSVRKFLDRMIMENAGGLQQEVESEDLERYFDQGGEAFTVNGTMISSENFRERGQQRALQGMSKFQLARQAEVQASMEAKAQPVTITNANDIGFYIGQYIKTNREGITGRSSLPDSEGR